MHHRIFPIVLCCDTKCNITVGCFKCVVGRTERIEISFSFVYFSNNGIGSMCSFHTRIHGIQQSNINFSDKYRIVVFCNACIVTANLSILITLYKTKTVPDKKVSKYQEFYFCVCHIYSKYNNFTFL